MLIVTNNAADEVAARHARLALLHNRATRYEVALRGHGRQLLIGYTGRRSRTGLLATLRVHGEEVLAVAQLSEKAVAAFVSRDVLSLDEGWTVAFTGRTEREAVIAGELESVRS